MPSPDGPLRSPLLLPRLRPRYPRASSRRGITVTHWMRAAFLWTILISRTPRRMTEMRRMQRTAAAGGWGGGRWEQTRTTPDPGALEPGRCLLTHACVSSQHDARARASSRPPQPAVVLRSCEPSPLFLRLRDSIPPSDEQSHGWIMVNWIMTLTRSLPRRSTIA